MLSHAALNITITFSQKRKRLNRSVSVTRVRAGRSDCYMDSPSRRLGTCRRLSQPSSSSQTSLHLRGCAAQHVPLARAQHFALARCPPARHRLQEQQKSSRIPRRRSRQPLPVAKMVRGQRGTVRTSLTIGLEIRLRLLGPSIVLHSHCGKHRRSFNECDDRSLDLAPSGQHFAQQPQRASKVAAPGGLQAVRALSKGLSFAP